MTATLSFSKDGKPLINGSDKQVSKREDGTFAITDDQGNPWFNVTMKPGEVKLSIPVTSGYRNIDLALDRNALNEMADAQGNRVTRVLAESDKPDAKIILTLDVRGIMPKDIGVSNDLELKFADTPLVYVTPSAALRPLLEVEKARNVSAGSIFDDRSYAANNNSEAKKEIAQVVKRDIHIALCAERAKTTHDFLSCLPPQGNPQPERQAGLQH